MVKFFEDGTVRTLYVGNFKNGMFNDYTGNAWIISKVDNDYFYYKGNFDNGMITDTNTMEIPISQKDIETIANETYFNCELKWSNEVI